MNFLVGRIQKYIFLNSLEKQGYYFRNKDNILEAMEALIKYVATLKSTNKISKIEIKKP